MALCFFQTVEQLETHKSTLPDISAMELGDSVSARAGSRIQVLHRLLRLRARLHGAHVSRTYVYALSVRITEMSLW